MFDLIGFKGGPIIDIASGKCLDVKRPDHVIFRQCNSKRRSQRWTFPNYTGAYREMLANSDGGRYPKMHRQVKRFQAKFLERQKRSKT